MVIYWSKVRRPVYGTATVKELSPIHTKDDEYKDNYISATPVNYIVCLF